MIKKIKGIFQIDSTDSKEFHEHLEKAINAVQGNGKEPEVQYRIAVLPTGEVVHAAVVLGREIW